MCVVCDYRIVIEYVARHVSANVEGHRGSNGHLGSNEMAVQMATLVQTAMATITTTIMTTPNFSTEKKLFWGVASGSCDAVGCEILFLGI